MQGLRVLLVDDEHSMPSVSAQLRQPELQYAGKVGGWRLAHPALGHNCCAIPAVPLLTQPRSPPAVTTCSSSTEALAYSRAAASAFDVVLAEVNHCACTCLATSG